MTKPTADEYYFELSGYVLNCAQMVLSPRGGTRYSVLRFLDVLRRVIDLTEFAECINEDPYLIELKEKLVQLPIERDQMDELGEALQELLNEYAVEASQRI